jgi:hypothetical protein
MIKLVFSWNIKGAEEREYFEFMGQEFAPKIQRLGIRLTEAWFTVYGSGPQIIVPGIAVDKITLEASMQSDEWLALTSRLQNYVTDYKCRISE